MSANSSKSAADEFWMRKAIALARKGEGLTRPNPPVGAVLVRNGKEIGCGFHKKAGGQHAEIVAMAAFKAGARGATLHVTLEPCSTHGRTPPCTEAIIRAGIKRVVVSVRDPNPKHKGRGIRLLKSEGIEVTENVCTRDGDDLIAPFAKWITTGKPFITLKLGMSLDGKIADYRGQSRWITSAESRMEVHRLRHGADAIMVGAGTIRADNPSLLCAGRTTSLFRIILTTSGSLSLTSRALNDGQQDRTIIATTRLCAKQRQDAYRSKGAHVWELPLASGQVSVQHLVERIGRMGLLHIVCEGGAELAASLIKANAVDQYLFFIAPRIIGGRTAIGAVGGKGLQLNSTPMLEFVGCSRFGRDIMIRAVPVG